MPGPCRMLCLCQHLKKPRKGWLGCEEFRLSRSAGEGDGWSHTFLGYGVNGLFYRLGRLFCSGIQVWPKLVNTRMTLAQNDRPKWSAIGGCVGTHLRPQSSNDHYPYPFDDLHISAPPLLMSGRIFHNQVKRSTPMDPNRFWFWPKPNDNQFPLSPHLLRSFGGCSQVIYDFEYLGPDAHEPAGNGLTNGHSTEAVIHEVRCWRWVWLKDFGPGISTCSCMYVEYNLCVYIYNIHTYIDIHTYTHT
jgi:hypothetical protein